MRNRPPARYARNANEKMKIKFFRRPRVARAQLTTKKISFFLAHHQRARGRPQPNDFVSKNYKLI